MKVALLLPGYLDSPDYLHLKTIASTLAEIGYEAEALDPCRLWETGNQNGYTVTNYLKQITDRLAYYSQKSPSELVLIGHSLGGLLSIIAGSQNSNVTRVVSLCAPPDLHTVLQMWKGRSLRISRRDLPRHPSQYRYFEIPITFAEDAIRYSAVEVVNRLSKPLMIFIAGKDTTVLPESTAEIVKNAGHPHIVREAELAHNFRLNPQHCQLVADHIRDFLSGT
jgi:esterase/lipase